MLESKLPSKRLVCKEVKPTICRLASSASGLYVNLLCVKTRYPKTTHLKTMHLKIVHLKIMHLKIIVSGD